MQIIWRWDQGRLTYFQFENLKRIARVLYRLDGVVINQKNFDPLRAPLENEVQLPFAPNSYTVWRNYKRVFECGFLATSINEKLVITDFCRFLVENERKTVEVDDYLSLFISRFRFPFAAFTDYKEAKSEHVVYPLCCVLKLLLARFLKKGVASITLEEVFTLLIANRCTGLEPIEHYGALIPRKYLPSDVESRQVRELLIFTSQLSILKWFRNRLHLDITLQDYEDYNGFQHLVSPVIVLPKENKAADYLAITSLAKMNSEFVALSSRESPNDQLFIEGKRSRVTHIKIERSPLLRKLFFEKNPTTTCDMCVCNTRKRYPWTDNMLEVHHILPLCSTLTVTSSGTSLEDVVGLCPNCHKSVHTYYKNWLDQNNIEDFRNKAEAVEIYREARQSIIV